MKKLLVAILCTAGVVPLMAQADPEFRVGFWSDVVHCFENRLGRSAEHPKVKYAHRYLAEAQKDLEAQSGTRAISTKSATSTTASWGLGSLFGGRKPIQDLARDDSSRTAKAKAPKKGSKTKAVKHDKTAKPAQKPKSTKKTVAAKKPSPKRKNIPQQGKKARQPQKS